MHLISVFGFVQSQRRERRLVCWFWFYVPDLVLVSALIYEKVAGKGKCFRLFFFLIDFLNKQLQKFSGICHPKR